jgi:hypothetical protein
LITERNGRIFLRVLVLRARFTVGVSSGSAPVFSSPRGVGLIMEPPCVTIRCHISVGDSVRAWYEMADEALQGVAAAKK